MNITVDYSKHMINAAEHKIMDILNDLEKDIGMSVINIRYQVIKDEGFGVKPIETLIDLKIVVEL